MGEIGTNQVSPRIVSGALRAIDILVVLACSLFSFWAYLPDLGEMPGQYIVVVAAGILLQAHFFQLAGLYRFEKLGELQYQLGRLLAAWSLTFFVLATGAFLTKVSADYSRGWALIWFVTVLFALASLRVALYYRLRSWIANGRLLCHIAIVGAGENGRRLIQYLNGLRGENLHVVGVFDDRASRVFHEIGGHHHAGTLDDLLRIARTERIDQILVALPWSAEERLLEIMQKLKTLPVDVRLSPDMIGFRLFNSSFGRIGGLPLVNVFHKPLSDWRLLTKEIEDRITKATKGDFLQTTNMSSTIRASTGMSCIMAFHRPW